MNDQGTVKEAPPPPPLPKEPTTKNSRAKLSSIHSTLDIRDDIEKRATAVKAHPPMSASRDGTGWKDSILVARIARPTSLEIWHRKRSHRRPNRSKSPNLKHFASLDLKKLADFRIAGQRRRIFAGASLQFSCGFRSS